MPLIQQPELTAEQKVDRAVRTVLAMPDTILDTNLSMWENGLDALWTDEGEGAAPADKLAGLGNKGAEIFAGSNALGTFLIQQAAGKDQAVVDRIMARIGSLPLFTAHEDGTVTLDEPDSE